MIVATVTLLAPIKAAAKTALVHRTVVAAAVLVPISVAVVPVPISIFCNSYASQLPSYVVHIVQLRLLGCKQGNWCSTETHGKWLGMQTIMGIFYCVIMGVMFMASGDQFSR